MSEVTIGNSIIKNFQPENIMYIAFVGNIDDDSYKEIWETAVDMGVENKSEKFIIDQSQIGNVSFKARGWVVLKMLPKIKKVFGSDIFVGVVTAKDLVNKSGVKYITGMFEKMAGLTINFYPSIEDAKSAAPN